jgi:hypothetical protein
MSGQLCWLPAASKDGENILHLRLQPHNPWKPYTAFPQISVPDYKISGGSRGWATCQHLMNAGWTIIPSPQPYSYPWQDLSAS